jgi:hypothetical protein
MILYRFVLMGSRGLPESWDTQKRTVCIIFFTPRRFFDIYYKVGWTRRLWRNDFVAQWGEKRSQGIQRYRVTSLRTYSLDVIAFNQSMRTEHVVRIVDISVIGVGIETNERIEPGLICFREQIGGQKYGVLVWSKQKSDKYRAGMQFVILSPEEEAYLQEQFKQSTPCQSIRDPDKIIASLLESVKNEIKR